MTLKQWMKDKGYTNADVAKIVGCSRHAVWRWMKEPNDPNYRQPSAEMAAKLVARSGGQLKLEEVLGVARFLKLKAA